jgi:hypothetical protein
MFLANVGCSSAAAKPSKPLTLEAAVKAFNPEAVVQILEAMPLEEKKSEKTYSAMNAAAGKGDPELLKAFLTGGVPIRGNSKFGITPLMIAARDGRAENVKLLLDWGADRKAVNERGMTAYDYAGLHGFPEVAKLIAEGQGPMGAFQSPSRTSCAGSELTSQQKWVLSTYAIVDVFKGEGCLNLGGRAAKDITVAAHVADFLGDSWRIRDRGGLIDRLTWLRDKGDRTEFDELRKKAHAWGMTELVVHQKTVWDRVAKEKLANAWSLDAVVGDQGIIAWDLINLIWFANKGFAAGYLKEEEAWAWMEPAAKRLQASFHSWKDCQDSFVAGHQFGTKGTDTNDQFKNIELALLDPKNSNSPWNTCPWDTPLADPDLMDARR